MELYNAGNEAADLTGWTLKAADGSPNIVLSGTIGAHEFFLLERTDDTTISDISADQIYTGTLKDSGETLILADADGQIMDEVICGSGWYAGLASPRMSMERINPLISGADSSNWATNTGLITTGENADTPSGSVLGTPKFKNSVSP